MKWFQAENKKYENMRRIQECYKEEAEDGNTDADWLGEDDGWGKSMARGEESDKEESDRSNGANHLDEDVVSLEGGNREKLIDTDDKVEILFMCHNCHREDANNWVDTG